MAATLTPVHADGSTNGRGIKVAATATPGTLLHTATAIADEFDEVVIYAVNTDTTARELTVEFGGTNNPDDRIIASIPPRAGLQIVVPGMRLSGGSIVRAFAATANVVVCHVNVTRYKP